MGAKYLMLGLGLLVTGGCGSTDPNPADSSNPQVSITSPVDGATVNGQVSIDVTAVDDFGVDQVRIYIDNGTTPLATLYTAPFHAIWNTSSLLDNSTHSIKAEAFDVAGNFSTQQIVVTVSRGPN